MKLIPITPLRTIWQTKTARSASIATIAGLAILMGANVTNLAKRHYPKHAADIDDISAIVLNLAGLLAAGGGMGAVLGRAAAVDPVTSPSWMPGENTPKGE